LGAFRRRLPGLVFGGLGGFLFPPRPFFPFPFFGRFAFFQFPRGAFRGRLRHPHFVFRGGRAASRLADRRHADVEAIGADRGLLGRGGGGRRAPEAPRRG